MVNARKFRSSSFDVSLSAATLALALASLLFFIATQSAPAQTFSVVHNFTGGADGGNPYSGVTIDVAGNLYGTAMVSSTGYGTVYKLTHKNGNWIFAPLYKFAGGNDGAGPKARVVIGPNGSLYGTTYAGGGGPCTEGGGYVGCGIVFNLKPPLRAPPTPLSPWVETVLYRFQGQPDGALPEWGDLLFDRAGNLYGTTAGGGTSGEGTVFELTPSPGGWIEKVINNSTFPTLEPYSGVIFDSAGNLYGTGTFFPGGVYELTPSGPGWVEQVLYTFQQGNDGAAPFGGVIFDRSGNLYGTTLFSGAHGGGTVYQLSPSAGGWTLTILYSFSNVMDTGGSAASLTMDASGALYGTTSGDGAYGFGNVFKLTPSNGGWIYTSLHDFTGGSGGSNPYSSVTLDANGNLYGTTLYGGSQGNGVVWEITP